MSAEISSSITRLQQTLEVILYYADAHRLCPAFVHLSLSLTYASSAVSPLGLSLWPKLAALRTVSPSPRPGYWRFRRVLVEGRFLFAAEWHIHFVFLLISNPMLAHFKLPLLVRQAVQQGKLGKGVEIHVHELSNSVEAGPSAGGMRKWRSSTWVRGREYSWVHTAAKKQAVVHDAAARLLEELLPGEQGGYDD